MRIRHSERFHLAQHEVSPAPRQEDVDKPTVDTLWLAEEVSGLTVGDRVDLRTAGERERARIKAAPGFEMRLDVRVSELGNVCWSVDGKGCLRRCCAVQVFGCNIFGVRG